MKYFQTLRNLFSFINFKNKFYIFFLILLSIMSSISEVLSIALLVPFITLLSTPESITSIPFYFVLNSIMEFCNLDNLSLFVTITFTIFVVTATLFRFFVISFQIYLSKNINVELMGKIYDSYIKQPYNFHLKQNSSEILSSLVFKSGNVVANVLFPILTITANMIMGIFIISGMLFFTPIIVLASFVVILFFYLISVYAIKNKTIKFSINLSLLNPAIIKSIQETIGGIKEIILSNSYEYPIRQLGILNEKLQNTTMQIQIFSMAPRFFIEGVGIASIAIIAYNLSLLENFTSLIITLVITVYALQRLLPIVQNIYQSYITIKSSSILVKDTMHYLNLGSKKIIEENIKMKLKNSVKLENIFFKYENENNFELKKINIQLFKNRIYGMIGNTGCGKSTILDIIMFLLKPIRGKVIVDDIELNSNNFQSWQKNISHVPQTIFLMDDTLESNIIFNKNSNIDYKKLEKALKIAELNEFVDSLPDKLNTVVGERGSLLSGGQIQRVGIARAFYRDSEIIILDEATSALDKITELKILNNIKNNSVEKIILMISHNQNFKKICNELIYVDKGTVKQIS